MRSILLLFVLSFATLSFAQCPFGQIPDCNGDCQPAIWVGDGVCDDGWASPADFLCAAFNWDDGDCTGPGCMDTLAVNYNPMATVDDGSCIYDPCPPGEIPDCNGNCQPAIWVGDGICDNGWDFPSDFLCAAFNFDGGDCIGPGCMDTLATNYNPVATVDDGSCFYGPCPPGLLADCSGITCYDSLELMSFVGDWHCNNGLWTAGSWEVGDMVLDCAAYNYDGGDCVVTGCTDPAAWNYYEHATTDDGTCQYGTCPPGTEDCMGHCIPQNWIGVNDCPGGLSADPLAHLHNGAYPDSLLFNIPVGSTPRGMCVLPDGSKAFIGSGATVSVVDLQGLDAGTWSTTTINVGGLAYSCSPSADNLHVFVANFSLNAVQVIDVASNTVVQQIPISQGPLKMWTAHNGQRVFVSCQSGNAVSVIDANTWQVIATVPVGMHPRNICTSMNDSLLYVADWSSATVSVVDLVSYQVIDTVAVDYWPQAIWPTPDGKYILAANFGFDFSYDHVSVIRTSDHVVIARLRTGVGTEDILTIGGDGQYLYASNWGMTCCFAPTWDACCSAEVNKGSITVIAMPDFEAWVAPDSIPVEIPYISSTLTTVATQAEYALGMARHPNGRFVFAVNMDSDMLSVVGLRDLTTGTPIPDRTPAITLWPVPARSEFRISGAPLFDQVRLLDAWGRVLRQWRDVGSGSPLDLTGMPPGIYGVEIGTGGTRAMKKLVVE
ncbi:MAG: T9SS type A sorting domain-containing protein [Flavobacteriales bacterium]|nr:T9SS type A sorting domain-containing protein [Flavobacteriales bacterium]MBP6696554.1 T9SS type A sorting domain-containing protein [Flavobacteriales bacterium]